MESRMIKSLTGFMASAILENLLLIVIALMLASLFCVFLKEETTNARHPAARRLLTPAQASAGSHESGITCFQLNG